MDAIEEQAARWVARLDGTLKPEEEQELRGWLGADARHRGAYARALGYWVYLERLAALNGPARVTASPADGSAIFNRRQLVAAIIAAVATSGSVGWWLLPRRDSQRRSPAQRYQTRVGEIKRVALGDGSVLMLNTASAILVQFNQDRRNVQLVSGEVLFEIAHDKARPFIVSVKNAAVRAVGTAFAVRLESTQVAVTVTEGVVEVARSTSPDGNEAVTSFAGPQRARVFANQQAIITDSSELQIRSIKPADANRELAWREGLISFNGQSLQEAVAEINRYNVRQIIVNDLTLAAKPVVGVFGVTDLEGFAAAAAAALNAKIVVDGSAIRLESDPGAT